MSTFDIRLVDRETSSTQKHLCQLCLFEKTNFYLSLSQRNESLAKRGHSDKIILKNFPIFGVAIRRKWPGTEILKEEKI